MYYVKTRSPAPTFDDGPVRALEMPIYTDDQCRAEYSDYDAMFNYVNSFLCGGEAMENDCDLGGDDVGNPLVQVRRKKINRDAVERN